MSLKHIIFPEKDRTFSGKRSLKILLRSLHLVGATVVGGGIFLGVEADRYAIFLPIAFLSGIAMVLIDILGNGVWFLQLRGLIILLKIGLLFLLPTLGEFEWKIGVLGLVFLSGIISHATGNVRYYSLWHRKRVDALQFP